ncbi:ABC transporter permease [Martelella lutilitoris]|uniref:ABC transporter permease n=1 Tax=Martelella lutilitoris TaxID=2583532 RepID=A0A5C4JWJ1_9HYPH|nr:ABC transporter permease [Martelella lutilitoris]QQM30533.1 ABC transporter permease [Martelella lutilitoris]TNB49716.1 ABC transporter permease [Martelella lutilitoris]
MRASVFIRLALLVLLIAFISFPEAFAPVFRPFTQNGAPAIYTQTSLLSLTLSHLAIVGAATVAATLFSVGLAIIVTRPFGVEFLPLSRSIANIGQTFPPVAVLALAVPMFGFGPIPTLIALFLYGLLPIFENALTGLTNLPGNVSEAARGVGMTGTQRLMQVEFPLAFPVILAGIRLSVVISLATATIGSTVAAKTLGEVIIAGLLSNNTAFVLQGGLVVGVLALLIHDAFVMFERATARRTGRFY